MKQQFLCNRKAESRAIRIRKRAAHPCANLFTVMSQFHKRSGLLSGAVV